MLPGLLGQDGIGRVALPDRLEDEPLGHVVGLGDHVAGALVVDPLDALVALHEEPAGAGRDLEAEGQLVGERRAFGWTRGRRHDQ